jgi:hypothetical protein
MADEKPTNLPFTQRRVVGTREERLTARVARTKAKQAAASESATDFAKQRLADGVKQAERQLASFKKAKVRRAEARKTLPWLRRAAPATTTAPPAEETE